MQPSYLCTLIIVQSAIPIWLSLANDTPTPVFKSMPTTIKTSLNDTVSLPCYVENLGTNIVRWWKNDKLLWDTGDKALILPGNMRIFPNQTLEVKDLQDSDTGDYICQVVRPHPWNPINQAHAIEVLVPPQVKPMPEDGEVEVELGHEVVMGCITKGVPPPAVTWSFKGDSMELINNRATLRWTVTDRKMAGNYQCTANNGVGDTAAASIRLKILYQPEVSTESVWIHTAPSERAEMSCIISAEPEAKIEWFFEDRTVNVRDGRIMAIRDGNKHKLIIKRVISSDLGFYTCKASNRLGRGQQSILLSGLAYPPSFKRGLKQSSSHNYTLIWEVESYSSIIEYKLLFKNHEAPANSKWTQVIVPADPDSQGPIYTQSYTIYGLQESTVYEAYVVSRNRFGWSRQSHIYRFATVSPAGTHNTSTKSVIVTSEVPTFAIFQNLTVSEDSLQRFREQDEVTEGNDKPIYEENSWNKAAPASTMCFLTWSVVTFLLFLF